MSAKIRLDQLLVDAGLAPNRSRAKALVLAGKVIVGDHRVDKPGHQVLPTAEVRLKSKGHDFVSRGALKLSEALKVYPCETNTRIALDVGASTGGFTEVWLRAGVAKVYAVDVGTGQLAWSLQTDERVDNLEKTHIGKLAIGRLHPAPERCSIDVSFIGLSKVLPMVDPHLAQKARIYALIKPQFEAGREHVGKGGIVRDEDVRQACIRQVHDAAAELGWDAVGYIESPIQGADGNIEYLAVFDKETA